MSPAVSAILEGMPNAYDLRLSETNGKTVVTVGSRVMFTYDSADVMMRNAAIATLRSLKFSGQQVAQVFGLSEPYVATVNSRVAKEGSAGLMRTQGRPPKLDSAALAQARAWRANKMSNVEIGRRLGVDDSTVSRALASPGTPGADAAAPCPTQRALPLDHTGDPHEGDTASSSEEVSSTQTANSATPDTADPTTTPDAGDTTDPAHAMDGAATTSGEQGAGGTWKDRIDTGEERVPVREGEHAANTGQSLHGTLPGSCDPGALDPDAGAGPEPAGAAGSPAAGSARILQGTFWSRYAGAMLVHAFTDRINATSVLATITGTTSRARFDDTGLLAATSMAFTLGASTVEQVKHLTAHEAGPLVGLAHLPDVRTLRPRLAALADRCDPLVLQRAFGAAMLDADPCESGVYYVDDHFVPYTGAKPVGKGWNTKRRTAEKGRHDTWMTAKGGRAVCFTTGEPSGLTKTMPPTLDQLCGIVGPGAKIMLGFDRGGAYPSVFTTCRNAGVHWVTYRRAPLAAPRRLPVLTTMVRNGKPTQTAWCEETVTLKDYGQCRQISVFEAGVLVLQVLTSDTEACPADLLSLIRSRWEIENVLKYGAHYGIDAICDYIAEVQTNTRAVDNPTRKAANTTVKKCKATLADAERAVAKLLADRSLPTATLNNKLRAAQKKTAKAAKAVAEAEQARDALPAKLPANQVNPDAKRALLRTQRRCLQMVLRLLGYNAEHWLSTHLNAYLQDDDEFRAITRETLIRGLGGTITYTTESITVTLDRPGTPKITRALALLIDEVNHTPPRLPGDPRPITYTITKP